MDCLALLQRRAKGAMHPVLQVKLASPRNHVRKKVAVERRVFL